MDANLRESFRILAKGRDRADIAELDGVSIASLGALFQMFNAAFLSRRVAGREDFHRRLFLARELFAFRRLPWAFWICEEWLPWSVRRALLETCEDAGMRAVSEMPCMFADALRESGRFALRGRETPVLDIRRAADAPTMRDFRHIGSLCFHVPPAWFEEVFDDTMPSREFHGWVGYRNGFPVATAATVISHEVIGLYNVATIPEAQGKGYGETITRHAITAAAQQSGLRRIILQSTAQGERLYKKLGFREISRLIVFNSVNGY